MTEKIMFVDENDQPIGAGDRREAWTGGMHVRIVRAILRDENGRILSQRRSALKPSYPNRWSDSVSGHVDEGETYDVAMAREMKEEINLETDLRFIGKFESKDIQGEYTIREFNAIYEGTIDSTTKLDLEPTEVTEVKWFEINELKSLIANDPDVFTPGFREAIRRYY